MGRNRFDAFLIFFPSMTTASKSSKQPGNGTAASGMSDVSRAVHVRSNARLTATGTRASLR